MIAAYATLFGLGRAGIAPGTLGSLAAVPVAYLLHRTGGFPLFLAGLVVAVVLGWVAVRRLVADGGAMDRPEIVADDFAGQLLALAPLSMGLWLAGAPAHIFPWPGWFGAFFIFRALVALKPPPVSWAGRAPGAAGVMADDLVAGALTAQVVTASAAISHGWI